MITLNLGLQFPQHNSASNAGYEVASTGGTSGTTGIELTAGHALVTTVASAFDYTSSSLLTGPSISEDSNIINAINESTDYLILQVAVGTTATPGNKSDVTLRFQYDEI